VKNQFCFAHYSRNPPTRLQFFADQSSSHPHFYEGQTLRPSRGTPHLQGMTKPELEALSCDERRPYFLPIAPTARETLQMRGSSARPEGLTFVEMWVRGRLGPRKTEVVSADFLL